MSTSDTEEVCEDSADGTVGPNDVIFTSANETDEDKLKDTAEKG